MHLSILAKHMRTNRIRTHKVSETARACEAQGNEGVGVWKGADELTYVVYSLATDSCQILRAGCHICRLPRHP